MCWDERKEADCKAQATAVVPAGAFDVQNLVVGVGAVGSIQVRHAP